jgi:hypothetical protein
MINHSVCNECGGKGCSKCHHGWECTGPNCNKCEMGWPIGDVPPRKLNTKTSQEEEFIV